MTRTWLAALLLLSSLVSVAPARAEGPATASAAASRPAKRFAKVPFRVVKLLPATQQALVYDRDQKKHVVVQVGDPLGTFEVVDVDDEELVLTRDGRELVLLVDPGAPRPRAILIPAPHAPTQAPAPTAPGLQDPYGLAGAAPAAPVPTATATPVALPPLDPYAAVATTVAAPAAPAPLDPYGPSGTPTAAPAPAPAPAPLDPYAPYAGAGTTIAAPAMPAPLDPYGMLPPAASTDAPASLHEVLAPPEQRASLQTAEVLDPYAEPKVVAAPAGAKPVQGVPAPFSDAARAIEIRGEVMTLQRAELQAAVASFEKLSRQLDFERTGRGVRLRQVPADSYAYRIGLRPGDVISAIDGAPLRGLDDAAAIYVGLDRATHLSLDVERGTARGTLRFTLR